MVELQRNSCFDAAIIIPLRAKAVRQPEMVRLIQLVETLPEGYEVIIVDDGSPQAVKQWLTHLVEEWQHHSGGHTRRFKLVSLATRFRRFSLARARNAGARAAAAPVVLFHDVDFLAAPSVYQRLLRHIKTQQLAAKPENFFCVPVAFLTEAATVHFMQAFKRHQEAWCFRDRRQLPLESLQFLVQGSSCIVMNRKDLLSIGGHDEGFKGHGAEDFELLHRLACRFPIAEKPPEYERNMGSGTVTEYRGFRAYFALYGEQCRQAGCTLVHLWHPKRKGFGYYRHKQNFKRLQQVMTNQLPVERRPPTISPAVLLDEATHG
ncbi:MULTISPECIES: glycosyltransferase [Halomonadaceae]|uniref:Glycosyltransferase n=1 Tax=Vreelandella glaciei TaxID=186761 RepID=A0A7Z0LTQ0_9GAMM|nr:MULTISPECIES: glycosyltransferase [Halomonas]AJY51401.1 Glycosyltransferase, capsule biosynthesis protein [Halomonas sp. KO116]NYS78414.1 glycosyltransferase [Halomonas glaciei]|tara:strand:+ start:1060 stop:2019 length:960 start_codon:yes stop_codon:yes gene_type:complete